MSNALQISVNSMRRFFHRGWAPFISSIARLMPSLQQYKARLSNGDYLILDLREDMCFGIFFHEGQPHELGTEKLLSKVLRPNDVVVDIGANIGYYTRIASRLVGAGGAVIAFEPMPAAYRVLQMNCSDLANVTLFPVALGDKQGETTFYVRKKGDQSSLGSDKTAQAVRVKIDTLDSALIARCSRIDFMKIDVEGFEREVLAGSAQSIATHRPIIYFELLQSFVEESGFGFNDYEVLFNKVNYQLKWIDHSENKSVLFSDTPSNYVVAIPDEKTDLVLHDRGGWR